MSWPSTPTTTTPLLSFFRVNRIPLPLPRLENGDGRSAHNISGRRAARQVRDRFRQSLKNRPQRRPAAESLHQLVGDVAGVEIGKHQHIRPPGDGRARRLPCRPVPHPVDAIPLRAAVRAVRKKGHDGLVADDPPPVARRRNRDLGELLGRGIGTHGAVGEGDDVGPLDHVERAGHGGDTRGRTNGPQGGSDRVCRRIMRATDHDVGRAGAHQARAVGQRMRECLDRRVVGGEALWASFSKQLDHLRRRQMGDGPVEQLDLRELLALEHARRFPHALVVSLGKYDTRSELPRLGEDAVQKRHVPNLRFSACCTAGWTSEETSPPKRATSRTRLELRYVRSNAGTRKTVSILGARLRFISAIWNSYSKSDTARSPRTITEAPTDFPNSASSPSNDRTSTRLSGTACLMSATRSSSEKSGCLAALTATATISGSTKCSDRCTRSSFPCVSGSKDPG